MSDEIVVRVEGLQRLDAELARTQRSVAGRALRAALRRAATPMLEAARANAIATGIRGYDSDALGAAMIARSRRRYGGTSALVQIGPGYRAPAALALYSAARRANFGAQADATVIRHGHLVEFGTVDTPAQPFLGPAFAQTVHQVVQRLGADLTAALERRGVVLGPVPDGSG